MSDFDWKAIVRTVAPGIATALGGPLAGMAVKVLGDKLGIDDATQESVAAAIRGATPDDLLKIKQAEHEFQTKMRELDIRVEEISAADRASARDMQVQTRARTPAVLSWIIVTATLSLEGYVMVKGIPPAVADLVAGRILGTLDAALMTVITFWLGAAHANSQRSAERK